MPDIGPGIPSAGRTLTSLLNGPLIQLIFGVKEIDFALVGIEMAMSAVSGGIHAVKEIHAPLHALQNIGRSPDSHQICGLILGKVRHRLLQDVVHLLVGLPHGKSSDGIAIQGKLCNPLRMLSADIVKNRSLIDSEQQLIPVDGFL